MYKRRRVYSEDMDDSQENTPGTSNSVITETPLTTNTNSDTNKDWDSVDDHEDTDSTNEAFNTAKFPSEPEEIMTPSTEALFRTLRRLKGKTIQCQHHIENMENHIMKGSCPRGLQINLQPNVPTIDTILMREWERLNLNHQSKLIICIRDYWKRHHQNLLEQCNKLEEELQSIVNQTEWTRMSDLIEKTMKATLDNYNKPRKREQGGLSKERPGRN
jgi:hypothetical protein